jgi:hypothetical protein
MMTAQVQAVVPSQALVCVASRQESPLQQPWVGEHACPPVEQVLPVVQVPVVLPAGTLHCRPAQQSAPEVHTEFCGWHSCGAWHFPSAPQIFEQHAAAEEQLEPLAAQVPASGVPPVGGGTWQALVSSEVARHSVPVQQVLLSVQAVPTGAQEGAEQCPTPLLSGMQSAPPQHWSENWQILPVPVPVGMQQPAWPV